MPAAATPEAVRTLHVQKTTDIGAPIDIAFAALLAELGPESQMPDGKPFPFTLEAWPGGRWFRDLGDGAGHLWGHVQVIKPPTLLEITGPLFMSYPAVSHVQYRLVSEGARTRLTLTHRAIGLILDEHAEGVHMGWEYGVGRVKEIAERRAAR